MELSLYICINLSFARLIDIISNRLITISNQVQKLSDDLHTICIVHFENVQTNRDDDHFMILNDRQNI